MYNQHYNYNTIYKNIKYNFLVSVLTRKAHGYVASRLREAPIINDKLRDLRCGLAFGMFIFFRLETLQRFRRLRKVDMYRRRTRETREKIFIVGTLLRSTSSEREGERTISILYMDKWFNRLQFDFRVTAVNFLGIAHWDLRSFFRSHKFFLGRRNGHRTWLAQSLKKRPGRWIL